jgi:hypothetical protein
MRNSERTVDMTEEVNNARLKTVNCNQPEKKKKEKTWRIACYTQTSSLEYEMSSRESQDPCLHYISPTPHPASSPIQIYVKTQAFVSRLQKGKERNTKTKRGLTKLII